MFVSALKTPGFHLTFPYYFHLGPVKLHPHLVFESFAYAVAFRLYVLLRRRQADPLDDLSRWSVIASAAVGAAIGSKLLYWFEDPQLTLQHWDSSAFMLGGKTIVGALIGGLFAVEYVKKRLHIVRRTGDLFAVPLCLGIAIGRIGCFLSGIDDHTFGVATTLPWGVNFGDGVTRHPTQLYELLFTVALGIVLLRLFRRPHPEGDIFKAFMVGYFGFRLGCDFLKPEIGIILGLSSIQWACVLMLCYYAKDVCRWLGVTGRRESRGLEIEATPGVATTLVSEDSAR